MRSGTWKALTAAACLTLVVCSGCGEDDPVAPANRAPRILDIVVNPPAVVLEGSTRVTGLLSDPDGDPLTIRWTADGGVFSDDTVKSTRWIAPAEAGTYTLHLEVSDGQLTTTREASVQAGNASLTVTSDPPGAFIELDDLVTGYETPHTFETLSPGQHTVEILQLYFAYDHPVQGVELTHGQAETIDFTTAPTSSLTLDLGRDDILEIGGIAFLPSGLGIIYSARTAEGTGVFNSALNPPTGTANGVPIVYGASVGEQVTISQDGKRLVFISEEGSPLLVEVDDEDTDGFIDFVGDVRELTVQPHYGPALSASNWLAYTTTPSSEAAAAPVLWAELQDTVLTAPSLATSTVGRTPTWEPFDNRLAFAKNGVILFTTVIPGALSGSDTLAADRYNAAPAWGSWGERTIALLSGDSAGALTDLRLGVPGYEYLVTAHTGLTDPRYLAWSPVQRLVAVTENSGGRGRVELIVNLPLP